MKCMVVVLALAGLVSAAPEADPQLLLNSAFPVAHPFGFNPLFAPRVAPLAAHVVPATTTTVVHQQAPIVHTPVTTVVAAEPVPVVAPAVLRKGPTVGSSPLGPVSEVRGVLPVDPTLGPHDCASASGCIVRSYINAGLARKRREAESDPQLLAPALPAFNAFPYGLNPYNLPLAAAPALYNNVALNPFQYAAGAPILPHFYNNAPLVQQVATVPAVQHVVAAAPAAPVASTVVKTVEPAAPVVQPVPAVQTVVAAAPAAAPLAVAPVAPAVVRSPIVRGITKKVTYTHLGAHPLRNPATVIENEEQVVY